MYKDDKETGKARCMRLTADEMLSVMERVAGMGRDEFLGRSRRRQYIAVRAILASALSREGFSLNGTGRVIRRDHATVAHMLSTVETWRTNATYPEEKELLQRYEIELIVTRRGKCGWFSPCTGECLRTGHLDCGMVKYDRCNG